MVWLGYKHLLFTVLVWHCLYQPRPQRRPCLQMQEGLGVLHKSATVSASWAKLLIIEYFSYLQINRDYCVQCFLTTNNVFTEVIRYDFEPCRHDEVKNNSARKTKGILVETFSR